jgi:hypothetical protein
MSRIEEKYNIPRKFNPKSAKDRAEEKKRMFLSHSSL